MPKFAAAIAVALSLIATGAHAQSPFVTGQTLGGLRNNYTGSLGFKFTVGSSPITVTELGRWVVSGNSQAHTVKLVLASSGANVSGGSVSVATSGATAGAFKYAALAAPVTLPANTAYYIVSQETNGGDQWCNPGAITHASVAAVNNTVYSATGAAPWSVGGPADQSYIPVSFKYTAAPVPAVPAVSANDFLDSIGINTHIAQGADNPTNVATSLTYTGIRNVRDEAKSAYINSYLTVHNQTGAQFVLGFSGPNDAAMTTMLDMSRQLANADALLALEGPNEPNNWAVTYQGQTSTTLGDFLPVAKWQRDFYAQATADAVLKDYPVFASSLAGGSEPNNVGLQYLTIPTPLPSGVLMPTGTKYADFANTHNYVSRNPQLGIRDNQSWLSMSPGLDHLGSGLYTEYGLTWRAKFNGYTLTQLETLPRVATETGWYTQVKGSQAYPITEVQQGKLFLNLYLAAYKRGWSATFIYMLHDNASQGYWGLYHTDWTAKPSATYLHNMTTILADTVSFTPGSLNYSIPSQPATVHDLLIQKSDGKFMLAVWNEKATGSNAVTVNLGGTYTTVKVYDPTVGTSAQQTLSNVSSVPLTLSDHPVIIEVPGAVGSGTPFVTGQTLGGLRNNYTASLGFKFTVGSSPITVTELGRWVVSGNTQTHTVKLVLASSGADVSGGSVSVATAGAPAGQFKYAALAAPVTLSANTAYYVVSRETNGGDQWCNPGPLTYNTSVATMNGLVSSATHTAPWSTGGPANNSYIPVSFKTTP